MTLMRQIREFPVARDSVALWWLGQNGFIFKSHEGTLVATDLYLTDSCVSIAPAGTDFRACRFADRCLRPPAPFHGRNR